MNNNWRVIPAEIVKEMAIKFEMDDGELLYLIANDELSDEMEKHLEEKLKEWERMVSDE